jgi:hypothetical protein
MDSGSSASLLRFSTDDYPTARRIEAWREVFGRTVVNFDIAP